MILIYRYILRSFFFPTCIGIGFFTFIFIINNIGRLVSLCLEKGVSILIVLQLFVYMLPFTAAVTVPMGVLFGVLMVLGRFSETSEIIAMRASGFSLYSIYIPTFLFGAVMSILMFWFINFVMPESNYRYKALYRNVIYSNPSILIDERAFSDFPSSNKADKKISALNITDNKKILHSVFLYEFDKRDQSVKITYSKTGVWSNNTINAPITTLNLQDGKTLNISYDDFKQIRQVTFDEIKINIKKKIRGIQSVKKGPKEQSVFEVSRRINDLKKNKKKVNARLWVEYNKKFSIPMACLIFVIVAFPLGINFDRSGRGVSFGLSIIVIFAYYILMTLGESLGYRGIISPIISMHIPNFVLLVAGFVLFYFKLRKN